MGAHLAPLIRSLSVSGQDLLLRDNKILRWQVMQLHSPESRIRGVIFMGKMLTLLAAGSNMTDMSVNVQCHAVQCLPVWDVDNVMQLWHLPATADPILVIGIYVSYVWNIALNRIDNIPWTIDCTTFTQRIWKSACDINGNVKLMFDDRVAWQNFCQSSVDKQNVDKAWQRQKKRASSLTSSSSINTRWSSTYFDELTTKRD